MKHIGIKLVLILAFMGYGEVLEAAEILPALDEGSVVTLKLEEDEVAIFGFGSLMLMEELHHDKEDPYKEPYIMARIKGFKRTWSAHYVNRYGHEFKDENGEYFAPMTMAFLNVEPSEESKVNGMLFVSTKKRLGSYDRREHVYNRIRVNDYLEGVRVIGDAYVYMAKEEYSIPTEYLEAEQTVIRMGYIKVIAEALSVLGEEFAEEFHETTQEVPRHLVYE